MLLALGLASPAYAQTIGGGGASGAQLTGDNGWTNRNRTPSCPLTDAATILVNAAGCNVRTVTLGGNRTLADPTSAIGGEWLTFFIDQDTTGSRTLGYGPAYIFPGNIPPTLSTAPGAEDVISCYIRSANPLFVSCPGFGANVTQLPKLLTHTTAQNAGAGTTVAVTLSTYVGHPLIIGTLNCQDSACSTTPTTAIVTGITATGGNTCTHVAATKNTSNTATDIWVCGGGTTGSNVFTITSGAGAWYLEGSVSEWAGLVGTCEVGNQNTTTASTTGSIATSGATTHANSVIYAIADNTAGLTATNTLIDALSVSTLTEYQIGGALGTYTNSVTNASSSNYRMSIAACH